MEVKFVNVVDLGTNLDFALTQALLAGAHLLQTAHQENISEPYPPHSKPQQYLHKITGRGRRNVITVKTSPTSVAVGYAAGYYHFPYMEWWEALNPDTDKRRLSLRTTFEKEWESIFERMTTVAATAVHAALDMSARS